MPAVGRERSGARILVTGSNGFIAVETCLQLARRGYKVTGTVRRATSGEYLKILIGDAFDFVIVEDFEKEDAFDRVIKDGDYEGVFHMGSPVLLYSNKPSEVIGPAVSGTTGIIKSVLKHGHTVKRCVITSSTASVNNGKEGAYTYTEDDWNEQSPELVERLGENVPSIHIYRASKVLAEKAAWKLVKENSDAGFDLVTILPPVVLGPVSQDVNSVEKLNETSFQLWTELIRPPPKENDAGFSGNMVDVRDVALGHILALETEEAGGERFIVSNGPYTWGELREKAHEAGLKGIAPANHIPAPAKLVMDGSKAARVLGLNYRTKEDTVVAGIGSIREKCSDASLT